jgi:hypothetical protein
VRLALAGELVPDAVNVAGGIIDPYVRPGIPLVEKLGQLFAGLAQGPLESLDVEVHGELVDYDVSVLKLAALKGLFTNVVSETVSYVNAPLLAEQRGVAVRLIADAESPEYRNVITLRGAWPTGMCLGRKHRSIVAQVSKPAVSPISNRQGARNSDDRLKSKRLQAGSPAIQQVWKPALR